MNILILLTSHDALGTTRTKTGVWLEGLADPYYVFLHAAAAITLASPLGGRPPIDPRSDAPAARTEATQSFKTDRVAQAAMASTRKLRELSAENFDALFYPGGYGLLWDLAEDAASIAMIEAMLAAGKPVAAVCHAPGVLRNARRPNGDSVLLGKAVTGFSNGEEDDAGLTEVVPFSVENMLRKKGGDYFKVAKWHPHVVTDGLLITGQNPASSDIAAQALLRKLASLRPAHARTEARTELAAS